ncbi:MAG: spore coat U domain-containing protein [Proteobacteria bacterium]|nr:spore coat U domain-containing protein [Pseudomonadota bacterium]
MKKILFLAFILCSINSYAQTCNITNITPVNFGNYDVALTTPKDATGSITISCDKRAIVTISLNRGLYSQSFSYRNMKHTNLPDLLAYNLYTSAGMTTVWGDGSGGSSTVNIEVKNNRPSTAIIYGRIFPSQNVSMGNYMDTVTITILP